MSEFDAQWVYLPRILEYYPADSSLIAHLYFQNEDFRSVCEDYCLARQTLSAFEKRPDALECEEIDEYRTIISELDKELRGLLDEFRKMENPSTGLAG